MRIYLRLGPFRAFPSSPTFSQKAGGHDMGHEKPCHFIEGLQGENILQLPSASHLSPFALFPLSLSPFPGQITADLTLWIYMHLNQTEAVPVIL